MFFLISDPLLLVLAFMLAMSIGLPIADGLNEYYHRGQE